MKQLLIIPNLSNINDYCELADKYNTGFEFNEFFMPDTLDDAEKVRTIANEYKAYGLPAYNTIHGAFFDVIPFSLDAKIKEIATLRIHQSIEAAKEIGAKAVVFHTNYNPFLNSKAYVDSWIKTNIAYWRQVLAEHPTMNIYLENMFDTTPELMEAVSEELCGFENYGVCLDYAHASLSQVRPEIWAERLGRFVKHIHINDNDGVSDLHQAWGDGIMDRSGFYESYEKYMNKATVLIETSGIDKTKRSLERLKAEGFINN